MNRRKISVFFWTLCSCFALVLIITPNMGIVAGESRIKPGIGHKCLDCHPGLKDESAKGNPHKPFKSEECLSCHSPHAAKYEFLLFRTGDTLCYICHESGKSWLNEKVVHLPVEYGECLKCHDPHVSPYINLLRQNEKDLCYQCHDQSSFQKDYVHQPIQEGRCTACHQSHASSTPFLLKQSSTELCIQCHPLNQKLISSHSGFQIRQVDCILCHTPHSSIRKKLVYSVLHDPFAQNNCKACHSDSSGSFKSSSGDAKSCYKCHQDAEERFSAKKKSHLVSGSGECIFCHNPHGAERKKLVRRSDRLLCTACHQEIGQRLRIVRKGLRRHPEVFAGKCSTCHDAHASDDLKFLIDNPLRFCTECHKRQQVACHPVGVKALDPRSKTPITCITCHNPMEAEFPQIMRLDGAKELCNQCHKY